MFPGTNGMLLAFMAGRVRSGNRLLPGKQPNTTPALCRMIRSVLERVFQKSAGVAPVIARYTSYVPLGVLPANPVAPVK